MADIDKARRTFVPTAGLGAAAAAAGPALAQQQPQNPPGAPTAPRAADYPKPPFAVQTQPWPGLASRMNPRPDHGETSYRGSGRLQGKRALITGGDSGIGRAAAIAYAREGADVVINHLPEEEPDAREVIELIRAEGRKGVSIPGDLRNERFCAQLVERAVRELGGLDILVNNAARQQTRPAIADISSEDFDATLKTNVYAPFWLTKAAVTRMQAGGVIVNTSSEQAGDPSEDLVDYALTRAAVLNFHQVDGQAAGAQGHPRECGHAGSLLDPAPGQRRRHARKAAAVRLPGAARTPRAARRNRRPLCRGGRPAAQLLHRPGVRRDRRRRPAGLIRHRDRTQPHAEAASSARCSQRMRTHIMTAFNAVKTRA